MKTSVDFSIYCSPTKAYGNVTGDFDLPSPVKIGDRIFLLKDANVQLISSFSGWLRVESIAPASPHTQDEVVIGLEDVVLGSREEAIKIGNQLKSELGLFCVVYD